jgi:hypothetical protein
MNTEEFKTIIREQIVNLKDYELNEIYNILVEELNLRETRKYNQEELYLNG